MSEGEHTPSSTNRIELDHERMQQPVDREADHILDPDRRLSDAGKRVRHLIDEGGVRIDRRDDLD